MFSEDSTATNGSTLQQSDTAIKQNEEIRIEELQINRKGDNTTTSTPNCENPFQSSSTSILRPATFNFNQTSTGTATTSTPGSGFQFGLSTFGVPNCSSTTAITQATSTISSILGSTPTFDSCSSTTNSSQASISASTILTANSGFSNDRPLFGNYLLKKKSGVLGKKRTVSVSNQFCQSKFESASPTNFHNHCFTQMASGVSGGKKSAIWEHFVIDPKTKKATCKADSNHVLSYCGTTTNLWNHIKLKHGYVAPDTSDKNQPITNFYTPKATSKKYDKDSAQQKNITNKLIKFVAKHYEPLSLVDNDHFREFVEALNPFYHLPSSKTLKKRMEETYDAVRSEVRQITNDPSQNLAAVTTDVWTSDEQNESYISLTAHFVSPEWEMLAKNLEVKSCPGSHTSDKLKEHLTEMADEWNIDIPNVAMVSDSGSNIKKANADMEWQNTLSCFDHILQNAILTALKEDTVHEVLSTCRRIVTHFHHSPLQTYNLKMEAEKSSQTYHKLKQECPTRWGSTFKMLQRMIEMKRPVINVLMESKKKETRELVPDAEFWVKAKSVCDLLERLNIISVQMCSETNCTTSSIYAIVMNLLGFVMKKQLGEPSFITSMKKLFSLYMEKRLDDNDFREIMEMAAVLDPRMKEMPFVSDSARKNSYKLVMCKLDDSIAIDHSCDPVEVNPDSAATDDTQLTKTNNDKLQALFGCSSFDCYATGPTAPKVAKNPIPTTAKTMFENYMREPPINLASDPLKWWKNHERQHPELAKLAKRYLGIPSTSVTSERAFSTAGLIVTEKRNRLKPSTVRMLHFLAKNM